MIAGVCGYGYTGSGAVLDLLREVDACRVIDDEFLLTYFPDGLEDLEYHLMIQPSRFFSSDIALLRFRELTRKLSKDKSNVYNRENGGLFQEISEAYIASIKQVSWNGYWIIEPYIAENDIARMKRKLFRHLIPKQSKLRRMACREVNLSIRPGRFYEETEKLLQRTIGMDRHPDRIAVLNQPFPANSPEHSMKLFGKDVKAIIVDRDPRDLYLLCKCHVRPNWIPVDSVEHFISYYRQLHTADAIENPSVLRIRFEDLVCRYEHEKDRIFGFLGIQEEQHTTPRKFFDPAVSVRNTQLFTRDHGQEEAIEQITQELPEYLYPFSEVPEHTEEKNVF